MGRIVTVTIAVNFVLVVFVLPVVTACYFLLRHQQSGIVCAASAVFSLIGGMAGFLLVFVLAAWLLPPGHELIDMQRLLVGLLLSVLVGLPLGTWSGAWSIVWWVVGRQHG